MSARKANLALVKALFVMVVLVGLFPFAVLMKLTKRADILLNMILPLVLGIGIYRAADMAAMPSLVRNYLPDGLWAYAFLSSILLIWDRAINMAWTAVAFLLAIGYEAAQYGHLIPGTGDIFDVMTYFLFFGIALMLNTFFKASQRTSQSLIS